MQQPVRALDYYRLNIVDITEHTHTHIQVNIFFQMVIFSFILGKMMESVVKLLG